MSEEAKRVVAEETWTAATWDRAFGSDRGHPIAQAMCRVAACAPEALRLLLDVQSFEGGLCLWCRHPSCGDEHRDDCAWDALMRKAGLR